MTTLADIRSKDWALSMGGFGSVVEGLADIHQCILIILTTVKGTDPLRPEFGCDIFKWIDKPVNSAIPNMIKEIALAINTWETRVVVKKITPKIEGHQITFSIEWETVSSAQIGTIQVTYGN